MSELSSYLRIVLVGVSCVAASGCDRGAKRICPPSIHASDAGRLAIEQYDANKDGKIAGDELDACPSLKSCSRWLDPKGDGVTAEMVQSMIQKWQATKIGRVSYLCAFYRNGKPIQGAKVTFVPEKFLGVAMPTVLGETDEGGVAVMSVAGVTPEGLPLGFYRVQVTKDGEDIPAKYNSETTLGTAVVGGGAGIAAKFNLKY